jgi:hypothetical protein
MLRPGFAFKDRCGSDAATNGLLKPVVPAQFVCHSVPNIEQNEIVLGEVAFDESSFGFSPALK